MKKNNNYLKIVEWSDEDGCYVGRAPGLLIGGVHGKDEKKVFQELCLAVNEAIELLTKEKRSLPEATASKKYSGRILLRLPQDLHQTLAIKALQAGKSINNFIKGTLMNFL
jgi:predicted HicB family RNase H-like nuclease